jgi:hypothetical protein
MGIAVACPECANSVSVNAAMAGRRVRCHQCRRELKLPSTLVESPLDDGFADKLAAEGERGSIRAWILGIAILSLIPVMAGVATLGALYYLWERQAEGARLAQEVKVKPAGMDLPPGAPKRAMRVTDFQGVFQHRGQLAQGDAPFKNNGGAAQPNRVCKEYVIDLEAGTDYVIDLEAPRQQFDAYLRLAQLDGVVIQEDDDGGGDLNSRIHFNCTQTGSYVVSATSLGGGFGPYTLTVRDSRFSKPK